MSSRIAGRRGLPQWRDKARMVGIVAVIVIVVALVLSNLEDTSVDWIVGDTAAPLALVLIVVFGLGIAIGWLLTNRRSGKY